VYGPEHTSIFNLLGNLICLSAVVHAIHVLESEDGAVGWDTVEACAGVHGPLEGIALPSKDIVGMLPEASPRGDSVPERYQRRDNPRIAHTENERLAAILWPQGFIVESASIPVDFNEEKRETNGVRGRTVGTKELQTLLTDGTDRVGNMTLGKEEVSGLDRLSTKLHLRSGQEDRGQLHSSIEGSRYWNGFPPRKVGWGDGMCRQGIQGCHHCQGHSCGSSGRSGPLTGGL
jgi:hypothetical protein